MKISATVLTALGGAGCLAQAGQAAATGGDVWSVGAPLTTAGIAGWLLMYYLPKREERHQQQIERQTDSFLQTMDNARTEHREEREATIARMEEHRKEHAETLAKIAEQHKEATQSGHAAARELGQEIAGLRAVVQKK